MTASAPSGSGAPVISRVAVPGVTGRRGHAAGADFLEHLANFRAIAADDGVAVHQRFVVGRRIDGAGDVLGEHQLRGFVERDPLRRKRQGMLFDQLQRFIDGEHEKKTDLSLVNCHLQFVIAEIAR